jgi:hypothetical protein
MTAVKDSTPGDNVPALNAPQSSSPAKDKRSSAPDADTPAKSAKKRRKVNHGMLPMLYTQTVLTALLT